MNDQIKEICKKIIEYCGIQFKNRPTQFIKVIMHNPEIEEKIKKITFKICVDDLSTEEQEKMIEIAKKHATTNVIILLSYNNHFYKPVFAEITKK